MTLPDNVQVVSLVEKPEPVTVTVDPAGAVTGLSTIGRARAPIVNVAEAESPVDPVAVMVKEPEPKLATTNDPVNVPPETEQV
ncbi:MAG TPA: hypothetical protein VK503_00005 [Candidatus Bathyarchaeia archaeon]|nr:hypothetical protein [Candidatus Bathyarchaeia archaeon]